jgi:hypothetical protein
MIKDNIIREPDFEPYGEVRVDSKNRISIGKTEGTKITSYRVYRNSSGQFILDPQVTIPAHEAWLYQNPKALATVKKGVEAARAGKLVKAPEDYSKYIDK